MYKELKLLNNRKTDKHIYLQWAQQLNKHSQRKIYRCPAAMSCHPQHVRLVIIKTVRDRKGWQGCRERRTPAHCGWCCKWAEPLQKTVQSFLAKILQPELPYNSTIPFLVSVYLNFPLFQQHVQCLRFEPILSKTCLFFFQFQMMGVQKQATPSLQPS